MPFNKGDFTQQGVAGHVNANLRLNEKRLVNIDLTSNEEAEDCTITGTVKDLLNDKVYPIGAGASGNIEITENTAEGEPLNIAQYATATVNVSGGGGTDFPKCTATIVNNDVGDDTFHSLYNGVVQVITVPANSSITIELPYTLDTEYEEYLVYSYLTGGVANNSSDFVSNMVNITTEQWAPDTVALKITDPTADSSVTLDIKFLQAR